MVKMGGLAEEQAGWRRANPAPTPNGKFQDYTTTHTVEAEYALQQSVQ